jgi:ribonuclease VapC
MINPVVDASAILAILKDEPGGKEIFDQSRGARISAVNHCEIVGWLAERGSRPDDIDRLIEPFDLKMGIFDGARAAAAGLLAAKTQRRGISLADRACLALALELGVHAITADRAWATLDLGVEVRLIR